MSTKKVTLRKMIHALRYGKNVKQARLKFFRYRNQYDFSDSPYAIPKRVIYEACALGKISLTLDVVVDDVAGKRDNFLSTIRGEIIMLNDDRQYTFKQIADYLEGTYSDKLDEPLEMGIFHNPAPVIEQEEFNFAGR